MNPDAAPRGANPPKLVGVEVGGGLGNQMFIYAAGLALSRRLGAELRCDTYLAAKGAQRPVGLREFGIDWTECRSPRGRGALRAIGRRLGLGGGNPFARGSYYSEAGAAFDPAVLALRPPCYLRGNFQSWRYFAGFEEAVRGAFDVDRLATGASAAMAARIMGTACPVAVHVRRGDYAASPESIGFHGLLTADHYRRARQAIEARSPGATYFLFSDDIGRAQAELGDWPGLVPVTGHSTHEDLRLMALCRHFVIANSTFSWWAAWLGRAPEKTVIAPKAWYGPSYPHPFVRDDLLPPEWIVL